MSNVVRVNTTLLKEDKEFLDTNFISLAKLIRKTINDQRNDQAVTRKSKLLALSNQPVKEGSK